MMPTFCIHTSLWVGMLYFILSKLLKRWPLRAGIVNSFIVLTPEKKFVLFSTSSSIIYVTLRLKANMYPCVYTYTYITICVCITLKLLFVLENLTNERPYSYAARALHESIINYSMSIIPLEFLRCCVCSKRIFLFFQHKQQYYNGDEKTQNEKRRECDCIYSYCNTRVHATRVWQTKRF